MTLVTPDCFIFDRLLLFPKGDGSEDEAVCYKAGHSRMGLELETRSKPQPASRPLIHFPISGYNRGRDADALERS